MKATLLLFVIMLLCTLFSCNLSGQQKGSTEVKLKPSGGAKAVAAFAEGCFWCSEHIFEDLAGVDSVVSGYAGGHTKNPTYEQVCTETTGHAETVLVYYNPNQISYAKLLDVFFESHDPTTLNRQGPDVGSSYRSAIFYQTPQEEQLAEEAIKKWSPAFKMPIVTQIAPLNAFYRAEEYHQNYVDENPYDSYVRNVSMPRYMSFKKECKLQFKKN